MDVIMRKPGVLNAQGTYGQLGRVGTYIKYTLYIHKNYRPALWTKECCPVVRNKLANVLLPVEVALTHKWFNRLFNFGLLKHFDGLVNLQLNSFLTLTVNLAAEENSENCFKLQLRILDHVRGEFFFLS